MSAQTTPVFQLGIVVKVMYKVKALGMVIGLIIYISGQKYLPKEHYEPKSSGVP